mgnify:FL=1
MKDAIVRKVGNDMRINKITPISSNFPIEKMGIHKSSGGKNAGLVDSGKLDRNQNQTDRVELGRRPLEDQIKSTMKESILKTEGQRRAEKLEALKQQISENRYFIKTDDIVKSML